MKVSFLKVGQANILGLLIFCLLPIQLVNSQIKPAKQDNKSFTCPNQLETLSSLLLKDLPQYSNRVILRTQKNPRSLGIRKYIIIASPAELEPLNLPNLQYQPLPADQPQQIFFTVLERQYQNKQVFTIQTYHWLFLVKTNDGWRMVMMFSRFGDSNNQSPPAPPIETTDGIIGQGVQLWLRDCRARTVRSSTL
ncbi:hypothetical protein NIES4102_14070 [Chondrocystis sp. NIES-4102]|nr:hypothetical protein NIES4102_14070 [Chondrocystis sp. NIES-4102]